MPAFAGSPCLTDSQASACGWLIPNTFSPDPGRHRIRRQVIMNADEARKILAFFRPGSADERDPWFHQARQLAESDPDLALWSSAHCESYLVMRQSLRAIPIPPALKEQILSEYKIQRPSFQRLWPQLLAAAPAILLLLGLASEIGLFHNADRFAAYRNRMTESAVRNHYMDLTTGDPERIRAFLIRKEAPSEFSLPGGFKAASIVGCVVSSWQGSPVSIICFKTGRALPSGEQSDLWLFVIDRKSAAAAPPPREPVFARVNKTVTASWSDDKNTYLLASSGGEAMLRKYLQQE